MDYERSMFGMKNADATCLAKAIKFKSHVRPLPSGVRAPPCWS